MKNSFSLTNGSNHSSLIYSTLKWLIVLFVVVDIIIRIVLLFSPQTQVSFSVSEWFDIFLIGFINDLAMAYVATLFIYLCLITLSDKKYERPYGYILWGVLLLALAYFLFFHTVADDYGSAVPKIVKGLLFYKAISFGLRLFFPAIRQRWSYVVYVVFIFITLFIMFVSASGEYFFWDEFGVRYNFIAVDYLVYTNEVVGNILESYAIVPLFSVIALISGLLTWRIVRKKFALFTGYAPAKERASLLLTYFILFIVALFQLSLAPKYENHTNVFVNELEANGIDKLYRAFVSNKLNYKDFYAMLPQAKAEQTLNEQYGSKGVYNEHAVTAPSPEIHKNIILITEESLSASYLSRYGNTKHLTPSLDKLMNEGLAFDSLFANGNRTVRGLEALTLCTPPSPGESIIKQGDNANLFSVGSVLRSKGYLTQFLYGGEAYFDNMQEFYSANGYQIIDKSDFERSQIHFSNIWGVCDEDIFTKAIEVMRGNVRTGKPAFLHIMTVSNHRPFTYPDGRIDISPKKKSRDGGVKYADYAIGKFIADASKEPWFKNTVIIIVADHCSSSAGKTSIPLDKYQIPALVYAPGFVPPQSFKGIASQADIMPTVFGLLHLGYTSYFYGQDVLAPSYHPRAFIATYQSMGYLERGRLVVLTPDKKVTQYTVTPQNHSFVEKRASSDYNDIAIRAVSNYQMSSAYLKRIK
jgi:phosphoglycerol transferase MdoB-like AlkP superfamily enzyme